MIYKKDFFIQKVKEQYLEQGNNLYLNNAEFISEKINNNSDTDILPVSIKSIQKGKFYFMFYDLSGKSSNMEKYNPILAIDWFDLNQTRYLYGVSLNFMPVNIRVSFFNILFNNNITTYEENEFKNTIDETPLDQINFTNVYKLLFSIGFEWTIRKFDVQKINKTYNISTSIIDKFITMSTYKFTGVPDDKLVDIWRTKIVKQSERQQKLIKELLNDYEEIKKELTSKYQSLDDRNENLNNSLQLIKNNIL